MHAEYRPCAKHRGVSAVSSCNSRVVRTGDGSVSSNFPSCLFRIWCSKLPSGAFNCGNAALGHNQNV